MEECGLSNDNASAGPFLRKLCKRVRSFKVTRHLDLNY
jgi:hypothetical protein